MKVDGGVVLQGGGVGVGWGEMDCGGVDWGSTADLSQGRVSPAVSGRGPCQSS